MSRARTENRRERTRFGVAKLKMNIDKETENRLNKKGMVPRWINDVNGRIQDAESGGYEFINLDAVKIGDDGKQVDEDRRITKRVGTNKDGSALNAYLMAIPKEYYEEDAAEKEKINRRVDDAIRGGNPKGLAEHGISTDKGSTFVKNVEYQP